MAFKPYKQIKVLPLAKQPSQPQDTASQIKALQEQVASLIKVVNEIQSNIAEAMSQVLGKDILDVSKLSGITLYPNMINKVPHGLGRRLQGWKVADNHGSYSLLTSLQDSNPSPNLLLWLSTPVQVTVDLEVY